jgi:hypothetical protein
MRRYTLDLSGFMRLPATHGNSPSYVDIVGVTGSIPVAPTIVLKGLDHPLASSPEAGKRMGSNRLGFAPAGASPWRRRRLELTRFRGAHQAFNGGFSDAQDASALFT